MFDFDCNNGKHRTTLDDPDYCAECGVKVTAAPTSAAVATPQTPTAKAKKAKPTAKVDACPNCEIEREGDAKFCSCCNYSFVDKKMPEPKLPGRKVTEPDMPSRWDKSEVAEEEVEIDNIDIDDVDLETESEITEPVRAIRTESHAEPVACDESHIPNAETQAAMEETEAIIAERLPQQADANAVTAPASIQRKSVIWKATVTADKKVYEAERHNYEDDGDDDKVIPFPTNFPGATFIITDGDTLIGRGDDESGIYPVIRIQDRGVSRSHATLQLNLDGSLFLMDLDSSSGTKMHGEQIPSHQRFPLQDGSQFTMGRWTKITIETLK